jgi:membrane protein implicated in regulation of membrane protease activity
LVAGLAANQGAGTTWQLAVFALTAFLLIVLIRPLALKGLYHRSDTRPTGVHAMLGQLGTVVDAIPGSLMAGRVKLGGEEWRALSHDNSAIAEHTVVTVLKIDSATVTVQPAVID